jgi:putative cardiolipin synthase
MHQAVENAAAAVKSELLLVSPYFIPGDDGMRLLKQLRSRNVRVRALTNSLGAAEDSWPLLAHAAYARYRQPLLEAGVELYEVRPVPGKPRGSAGPSDSTRARRFALHAKIFVFDRQRLFIGSMNFDPRSKRLNTEIGLIIDSPELAQQTAARLASIMQPANSFALALRPGGGDGQTRILWRTEEGGKSLAYERELARDPWQRFKVDFFALLPLEGEM